MSRPNMVAAASPAPQLRIGNYAMEKTVGSGSFGKVKKGYHLTTGVPVAIKIINKEKLAKKADMDSKIRREIYNLRRFRHPHIIKLYEVIETQSDIFLVMELVGGGELFDYIIQRGKLAEVEARLLFQQMISAVGYCHHHKVAHRDLKPENLLLGSSTSALKIADFGLSNLIQDGEFLKTSCGSPNYAAPEVIDGKYYAGEDIDVWSSGVILYALLTARLPFDDDYIPLLFSKIKRGKFKMPSFLSGPCQDLIRSMLVVDPLKRITIPEIKKHPWFTADLPSYLHDFPEDNIDPHEMFQPSNLDETILQELQHMYNMSRPKLLAALSAEVEVSAAILAQSAQQSASANAGSPSPLDEPLSRTNPLMVAYLLLYDQAESDLTPAAAIRRQMASSSGRSSYAPDSIAQSLAQLSTSPPMNLREEIPFLDAAGTNLNVLAAINHPTHTFQDQPDVTQVITAEASLDHPNNPAMLSDDVNAHKRPWYLGILSRDMPSSIMRELFRALRKLNFEWKITGPFQIQARALQPKPANSTLTSASINLNLRSSTSSLGSHSGSVGPNSSSQQHTSLGPGSHGTGASPAFGSLTASGSLRNGGSSHHGSVQSHGHGMRSSPKTPQRTSHLEVPIISGSPMDVGMGMRYDTSSAVHDEMSLVEPVPRRMAHQNSSPAFGESSNSPSNPPYVKLMIQLFKVNTKKQDQAMVHLLDIKKIQGEPIAFFDLCNTLMGELHL